LRGKLLSNHDETSTTISIELANLCPDSIYSQVNSNAEILRVDNLCSTLHNSCYILIEPCDTLYAHKFHHVQLITCVDFFKRIFPANCLSYTMLDKHVEIDQMLDNISMITSLRSLNNAHSCKFTFNLIVEQVFDKFFVCSMCITCDKLFEFKTNMSNAKHCEPYFPDFEADKLFNACCFEKQILFPCSYSSSKDMSDMQSNGIFGPKMFLSTSETNELGRYISNILNKLCNRNFGNISNTQNFETFNVVMVIDEVLNQLCCLNEIVVLPSTKLIAGSQTPSSR
jgi:hypothetical protein